MSVLVLQIIIKQWDKGQRSEQYQKIRSEIPDRYLLTFPPAHYLFANKVVIDQHGDDVQGNRINWTLTKDLQLTIDRFRICLNNKTLEYIDKSDSNTPAKFIGSLDNNGIQCKYNWRYSIYESGLYYWLYEEITLNAICAASLSETLFMDAEPTIICTDLR